ncbi:ROK family protein [Silvibacterium acidisoli]|uniref:ROK family protein n=1 Tax=Acidobacteriaceae bacterium ZG23-2 TaxID=2883246 RepID=UPI00406CB9FB
MSQHPMNGPAIVSTEEPSANGGCVIGVDIGGSNLRLALADMSGKVLARKATSTRGIREAHRILSLIREGVEELLLKTALPSSALRGIGAGAPGVTDVNSGVVIATSYLMGWRNVPLRDLLEETFRVPAAIDNDVNAAALGESWTGAASGNSDFVFLAIGTGVGAGIILNGLPFQGKSWSAGEIGYMLVPGLSSNRPERDKPGPLEDLIGGEGIQNQWKKQWSSEKTTLPSELTATQIFDHAISGDALAAAILQKTADVLAAAIHNISLVLNTPLFVLGGTVGMHPALRDATLAVLASWNYRSIPRLEFSSLGSDAQIVGAIRMALDAAHSPRAAALFQNK